MALIRKVGEIEVYQIDENINHLTRKQREKVIDELFRKEYVGKEIKYLLNGKEIYAIINNRTRNNFFVRTHHGHAFETNKEYNIRHDLAYTGDYINLISNANYRKSEEEQKPGQNKSHTNETMWLYLDKKVIVNGELYILKIAVRYQDDKYFIYNTKIKEADGPVLGSTSQA